MLNLSICVPAERRLSLFSRSVRTGMPNTFVAAIKAVPKIKGPIQLAGFLFTVFAAGLIYRVDPNNLGAVAVVGAIGVALVAIPLAFHAHVLKHIAESQRVWFLLILTAMFLFSFGALAYVTAKTVLGLAPQGARFDSRLELSKIRLMAKPGAGYRAELTWQLFSLSTQPDQGATVFLGMVVLHEEEKIAEAGLGRKTDSDCSKVPSCVGSHVFRELSHSPVLVRAGSPGSGLTTVVDVRRAPKNLRVWWEFYQREGPNGAVCVFDNTRAGPVDGLAPLAMFDKQGKRVGDLCYRSFGQRTIPVVF